MLNTEDLLSQRHQKQKINYDRLLQKVVADWKKNEERPKILLHSCCAPCSTYPLEYLSKYAQVTIYFANSNIHPKEEYERRKLVQEDFVNDFNERTGHKVGFLSGEYRPNEFIQGMVKNHLDQEKEGGARCSACFQLRLDLVAEKALELGFDYFGSALTLSPKKNSQVINEAGIEIQKIYRVNYLPADFKKRGGYPRSIEMCHDYNVYRQCYCGCIFAAKDQGIDLKEIKKEAQEYLMKRE